MTTRQQETGSTVEAVRERRRAMAWTMRQVEAAIAMPLRARPGEWSAAVAAELANLDRVLAEHIASTEGDGGFLPTLRDQEPRLDGMIKRLESEHVVLRAELDRALAALGAAGSDEARLAEVREQVTDLLADIARHRQRGADLLYEAYEVDLGGGG